MEDFEVVPVGTKAHIAELEEKIKGLEEKIETLEDDIGYMEDCITQLIYTGNE